MRCRSMFLAVVFATSVLVNAGCGVKGTHDDLMRYSPEEDSFEFLHSWTNIYGETDQHFNHLQSLWNRRGSIIVMPFQFLWGVNAVERIGQDTFRWIDLTTSSSEPEQAVPDINLDTIRVMPVPFYLNRHGNLCYVHRAVIPGKVIEEFLNSVTFEIVDAIAKAEKEQIESARGLRLTRPTWDDVRTNILWVLANEAGVESDVRGEQIDLELTPLDETSRNRLAKARTQKSIKLVRDRDVFSWTVPLSLADTVESIETFDLVKQTVTKYAQAGNKRGLEMQQNVEMISVRSLDEAGLELSINFTKLAKAVFAHGRSNLNAEPDELQKLRYKSTVESIRQRGIPIETTIDIEELSAKFRPN